MPPEVLVAVAAPVGFVPVVLAVASVVRVAQVAPQTNWKSFHSPPYSPGSESQSCPPKLPVTRLAPIRSSAVDFFSLWLRVPLVLLNLLVLVTMW